MGCMPAPTCGSGQQLSCFNNQDVECCSTYNDEPCEDMDGNYLLFYLNYQFSYLWCLHWHFTGTCHWECVDEEKPGDCNYFLNKCSELCNYNVLIAQCWGDPLYAYCKATDGSVFHIPGFTCEHPTCPPDAEWKWEWNRE